MENSVGCGPRHTKGFFTDCNFACDWPRQIKTSDHPVIPMNHLLRVRKFKTDLTSLISKGMAFCRKCFRSDQGLTLDK